MKIVDAETRIKAIQLGEAKVNFIRPDQPPIWAKFALLSEEGSACGYFEKVNGWSEKVQQKIRELAEAMEEDALPHISKVTGSAPDKRNPDEPPQF